MAEESGSQTHTGPHAAPTGFEVRSPQRERCFSVERGSILHRHECRCVSILPRQPFNVPAVPVCSHRSSAWTALSRANVARRMRPELAAYAVRPEINTCVPQQ